MIERYTRFGNYYYALIQIKDRTRRAYFSLAIDEFMFNGIEPQYKPGTQEHFLWQMLLPSLKVSLKQTFNAQRSKGKGTGPRPSMQGNQNARKQTGEAENKSLSQTDFIDAWNEATENITITSISDDNYKLLYNAWKEIGNLSKYKEIVKKASHENIFDGRPDCFNYLFNHTYRYRNYL